jgi:hypothetical protein
LPFFAIDFADGIAFFFSGVIAYAAIGSGKRSDLISDLLLPASVLVLLLLMATLVTSTLLDLHTDVAMLFSGDELSVVGATASHLPWGEVVGYCLIAAIGLNGMVRLGHVRRRQMILAAGLLLLQTLALAGSHVDMPLLTGEVAGFSRGTVPAVAWLFVALAGAVMLSLVPDRTS